MLKQWSMKAKLMGLIWTISALSLILFGMMAYRGAQSSIFAKKDNIENAAENIINIIDRNLFERYGDAQAFAVSDAARSLERERLAPFMAEMMTTYAPIYDQMIVVDASGRAVAVSEVDKQGKAVHASRLVGKDYSQAPWFKAALAGEVKPGASFVEDLHVEDDVKTVLGNSGQVMTFSAPIREKGSGKVIGVWSNRMSWEDVVETIVREEAAKVKDNLILHVFPYLISSDGTILVHPPGQSQSVKSFAGFDAVKAKVAAGGTFSRPDEVSFPEFTGKAYSSFAVSKGYSSYPARGWHASLAVPAVDSAMIFSYGVIAVAALILLAGLLAGHFVAVGLSRTFMQVVTDLQAEAKAINVVSQDIGTASNTLAQATTEQAAALQQTAASIEQMNAMVKKSTDNAAKSRESAVETQGSVKRGRQALTRLNQAIQEITESNTRIVGQIEDSNKQIFDIVRVINEIGNKTKVINDIVFQTKLLSFNASVEAARAGEHGKGFAVVAEEVGNLAQMSGNAAKEISEMLASSIQRVEQTVNMTKDRVQGLVAEGRGKLESGTVIARECAEIFDGVVTSVDEVTLMMGEISTASHEQAQGISEITKAMNQLDQVTHQNADTAQQSATTSSQLHTQSTDLLRMVTVLDSAVRGGGAAPMAAGTGVNAAVAEKARGKVIPFPSPSASPAAEPALRRAVGSDLTPDENDPRFRDV